MTPWPHDVDIIQGPLSDLTGFGWKFVEKNKKIIFGKIKKSPQKRINDDY